MKRTLWTAGARGSILVQQHLGVRLGRLALGCRHRCSSSGASLSIPQSLQSLPLLRSAMESNFFDLANSSTKTVRHSMLALWAHLLCPGQVASGLCLLHLVQRLRGMTSNPDMHRAVE